MALKDYAINQRKAIEAAKQVMANHLEALNKQDLDALKKTLHFPHYRLTQEGLHIWPTGEEYLTDFLQRAGENWAYTNWGELEVLQASDVKVHMHVKVERFNRSNQLITSFISLWVITCIDGNWAAQLRSSFAHQ